MPFFGVPIRNGVPIGLGSVAGFGISPFDPSQLFSAGEQGAWYDPSDLTTLYTTSAGTTPVAMPGLGAPVPVGLMLDKSQGLVLGSELVTNGDFSGGTTGWTADRGGSLSVVSGSLRVTQGAVTDYALGYQTVTLVIGQWYKLTVDFVGGTATAVQVGVGTSFTSSDATFFSNATSPRTLTVYFTAIATTMYVRGSVNVTTDNVYADFDNFSLKALSGNHAISFNNTAARPELRARVNLLTYSEEFSNVAWIKGATQTTTNTTATTAPDGTTTAELLKDNSSGGTGSIVVYQNITLVSNQTCTFSVYLKNASLTQYAALRTFGFDASANGYTYVDIVNGTIVSTAPQHISSVQSVGNGWYRFQIIVTLGADNAGSFAVYASQDGTTITVDLDGTSGLYLWGADLRPANIGANVPAYQRIADANTYDTSGFPLYLRFDGIDDSMYTPANLNLSGTDKTTVFLGLRKESDANIAVPLEFSDASGWTVSNGSFALYAPSYLSGSLPAPKYFVGLRGSGLRQEEFATFTAPISNVLAESINIGAAAASEISMRINGAVVVPSATSGDAVTANLGNYPVNIGRRPTVTGASYFPGNIYSLIIAGNAVSAGNISATEQWVAGKTGIQI